MNCINCKNKTKNIILNLKCKHQLCLDCLIQLSNIECPRCKINFIDEIPKKIINIIKPLNNNYSCPYHDGDIDCDASCFP